MSISISAVVSAYNEARTIEQVILDLLKISLLGEIIVINDGSSDGTQKILNRYNDKIKIIQNQINRGKGYGVAQAVKLAQGDLIILLDGDVINYTQRDLQRLAEPVINHECDFTLKPTDDVLFKNLSGIRCYRRIDILNCIQSMEQSSRYGLEIVLNRYFKDKKGKFIKLSDYHHFQKFEKFNLPVAIWEYVKEGLSLLRQLLKD